MKLILLFCQLLGIAAFAAPNDLLIQTRMDEKSLSFLIDKTRLIISNAHLKDGTEGSAKVNPDPVFLLNEFSHTPIYLEALKSISEIFHVPVDRAQIRIRIPEIHYKVYTIHADPTAFEVSDPVLDLKVNVALQGVDLSFPQGIQLDFMIPDPVTGEMATYLTANISPAFIEIPKTLEPAHFDVNFETFRESTFHFNLKSQDTSLLKPYIRNHVNEIHTWNITSHEPIGANDITINPIVLRLNSVSREIQFDELKPVVQSQMDKILGAVFVAVGDSLAGSLGKSILTTVFHAKVRSDLVYQSPSIYTRYISQSFEKPNDRQFRLNLSGEFCTKTDFDVDPVDCVLENSAIPPIRVISEEEHALALSEINDKIDRGEADVALSVSEEYLNRLLKTTLDANLWTPFLKQNHLAIGPQGAFLILNQQTQNPELYIDLKYVGSNWFERIFVNENRPLRFPIRVSTSLHFETKEGEVPSLVIQAEKLLSTRDDILEGIPEYHLDSQLFPIFRRWLARKILRMARKIEGKRAFSMELSIFKGVGLENTWIESSPYGRLHLYFKL